MDSVPSDFTVKTTRELYRGGATIGQLSSTYKISELLVENIVAGIARKNVEKEEIHIRALRPVERTYNRRPRVYGKIKNGKTNEETP